jgi:hypothetical protein
LSKAPRIRELLRAAGACLHEMGASVPRLTTARSR